MSTTAYDDQFAADPNPDPKPAVDFTKPIRCKVFPDQQIRYLGHRKVLQQSPAREGGYPVVYLVAQRLAGDEVYEVVRLGKEDEFENIPQSRWMNIYKSNTNACWHPTKEEAIRRRCGECLGLLERRDDGKVIFHPEPA